MKRVPVRHRVGAMLLLAASTPLVHAWPTAQAPDGGAPGCDLPGYFLSPTVVIDAEPGMDLVEHEQFGAALPICLEEALHTGQLKDRSNLVLGGFSHAGDFAAAAVVRWRAA